MKKHIILLLVFLTSSFLASQQKKHTVEAKETLYGLSKKYNITIDELKTANPQLNLRTLQIGEIIIIPDKTIISESIIPSASTHTIQESETTVPTVPTENGEYIYVTIAPKQTLYGLSKRYNTSVETIKKLNPKIGKNGPKIGEILRIPANLKTAAVDNQENEYKQDSVADKISIITNNEETMNRVDYNKGAVNVMFFLPFHKGASVANAERSIATEFYSGAKLALDSLSNNGKKINIKIFDSANDNKFRETINTYDFSNTHLIIGPLFKSEILAITDKINKIPIISPFSSSDDLDSYENVIQYTTKDQTIVEKLVDEMLKKYSNEKTYILYDDEHYKTALYFQSLLLNKKNNAEVILTKNVDDIHLEQNLVTDEYNKIYAVLISYQDALTNKYLENITKYKSNQIQPISLFYSSLFEYKKYEEKLLEFGFIYSDTDYVNEYGFNEQKTLKHYKQKFCGFPSKYAVTGFDVTYDILSRIDEKGNLSNTIMKAESKQLSNKYSFRRIKKNGAWTNQEVRIIQLLK